MSTPTKAELAAASIQEILNGLWKSNSENARFRSEMATLQGKIRTLEAILNEKERRLIHLADHLDELKGRLDRPRLPKPEPTEAEVVT